MASGATTADARPRVLIAAELAIPQCRKYRVLQRQEALALLGVASTVIAWRDIAALRAALAQHDVLILYRVPAAASVLDLISEAHGLGLRSCFEIDDLVCDTDDYLSNGNLATLGRQVTRQLLIEGQRFAITARHCRMGIASTPAIARQLASLCGRACVIRNGLDSETLRVAADALPRPADGRLRIFYGSGTRSHDCDFAVAAPAIAAVLDARPMAEMWLAGEVEPGAALARHPRLRRLPRSDFASYMAAQGSADIVVAPLEESAFNQGKSNIKYLEAGVLGLPCVCSGAAEFRAAVADGVTGFLAASPADWHAALFRLADDEGLRRRVGAAARQQVMNRFALDVIAQSEVAGFLRDRHTAA